MSALMPGAISYSEGSFRLGRFPDEVEAAFQVDMAGEKRRVDRHASILCALLYVMFGSLDPWAMPTGYLFAWKLRVLIAILTLATVVWAERYPCILLRHYIPVTAGKYLLWGLGIEALLWCSEPSDVAWLSYSGGVMLVSIALFSWTYIPATIATAVGCVYLMGFITLACFQQKLGARAWLVFALNAAFLCSAVLIGYYALMTRQRYARRAYVLKHNRQFELAEQNRHLSEMLAELTMTRQRLEHAERTACLGALRAAVAHEISNPAHFAYLSAAQLSERVVAFEDFLLGLLDSGGDDCLRREILKFTKCLRDSCDIVLDGTSRIRHLSRELASAVRVDEGPRELVRIDETLRTTVSLVQIQFGSHIRFELQFDASPRVECRPSQLGQVFMNLLINACHAIEEVQKTSPIHAGIVRISSRVVGTDLQVSVEDNGCGMPPAVIEQAFLPAFSTKPVGQGAGLGLAICRDIIEKHGGRLEVYSSEGAGSRFVICLTHAGTGK